MKGYKGLDKDFKCRGFQYVVGETYELDGEIEICKRGFHFCDIPLAVFKYYQPVDDNRFALVEATDDVKSDNAHKYCARKLTIVRELTLQELVNEVSPPSVSTNTGNCSASTNAGDYSAATNTGNYSASTNTGDYSAATNTGNYSASTNAGDYSAATNTGNYSASTNTGYCSVSTNTGNYSASTNTGDYSAATNTGNYSAATNTGDYSAAAVTGQQSIAIVTGKESKAKGELGCWLVLTEWSNTEPTEPIDVQVFKVDGEKIKADTFYVLKDGSPCEVND